MPPVLFDPQVGQMPPAGTIELLLEAPTSVGVYYAIVREDGGPHASAVLDQIHSGAATEACAALQRQGGWVLGGPAARIADEILAEALAAEPYAQPERKFELRTWALQEANRVSGPVTERSPAQLRMARVTHLVVSGYPEDYRLHEHVYIGPLAMAEDGRDYPVDEEALDAAVPLVEAVYLQVLQDVIGMCFPPTRFVRSPGAERAELVGLHDIEREVPRVVCPGSYLVARRMIARCIVARDEAAPALARRVV
jgi:hypothetical protein